MLLLDDSDYTLLNCKRNRYIESIFLGGIILICALVPFLTLPWLAFMATFYRKLPEDGIHARLDWNFLLWRVLPVWLFALNSLNKLHLMTQVPGFSFAVHCVLFPYKCEDAIQKWLNACLFDISRLLLFCLSLSSLVECGSSCMLIGIFRIYLAIIVIRKHPLLIVS